MDEIEVQQGNSYRANPAWYYMHYDREENAKYLG